MSTKELKSDKKPAKPVKKYSKSAKNLTENSKYIIIDLDRAYNLPAMDLNGFSDPYVKFFVGAEMVKSRTKKKTLNPVWNDQLTIFVDNDYLNGKGILKVEVWDWDMLKSHDYIGSCLVDLKTLPKDVPVKKNLKLDGKSGTIEFYITAKNFGLSQRDSMIDQSGKFLSIVENPLQVVLEKLENSPYANSFENRTQLTKFASLLSDVTNLKSTYLTTDWAETKKMHESLGKESEEDIEEIKGDDEVFKQDIKIKIIIVDQDQRSTFKKGLRQFLSPVMSSIDVLPQLGMFHSALMIGPWIIEWNNSALCIPRKCVSRAALLSADIDAIHTVTNLKDTIDRLAEVIVEWNTSKQYKNHGGDKSKVGNCQDFVEAVLNKLEIKINFAGPLGEFLKSLKTSGKADLSFKMDNEFRQKFEIEEKAITFKSHIELDNFVNKLVKKECEFSIKHKLEWAFLKSFDRAFWMRHWKLEEEINKNSQKINNFKALIEKHKNDIAPDELASMQSQLKALEAQKNTLEEEHNKVIPLYEEKIDEEDGDTYTDLGCPFNDPTVTYSVIFTNK